MRGFRFFEELREGQKSRTVTEPQPGTRPAPPVAPAVPQPDSGNVIAVNLSGGSFIQEGAICFPAFCTSSEERTLNGPVAPTYFNVEYLGKHCRRISETRARKIHPKLFELLDGLA